MRATTLGPFGHWVRRAADSEALPLVVLPVALGVAIAAAASPWLHAFRVPGQFEILVCSSAIPVAVTALVAGVSRRPPVVSYGISAGFLAIVLLAVSGGHLSVLFSDVSKVPDRLLTETLPITGSPGLLSPVLVLTWLCGAASAELLYRSSPRAARGELALAAPLVYLVLAYAVSAGAPSRDRLAGGVVLIGCAVVAVIRQDQRSIWVVAEASAPGSNAPASAQDARAVPVRRRTVLVRSVGACAALAIVLTAVLPSLGGLTGKPATLNKSAPVSTAVILDPVGSTATLRDGPPNSRPFGVVRVETDRPAPGYFSSAVLEGFDGSQWTFSATFEPTGGRVPPSPNAVPLLDAEDLNASETVESLLPGGLLPVADRAVSIGGPTVAVDTGTGMVLPAQHATGATFVVRSRVPDTSLDGIPSVDGIAATASTSSTNEVSDVTIPPDSSTAMEAALRFVAGITGTRPAATVAFLQRLLTSLRTQERHLTPYAPASGQDSATSVAPPSTILGGSAGHLGGTSLSEVINAITVSRSATPEQFATFFALVARYLGVPTRLATGFRVASGPSGVLLPAGAHDITNREAWTWVEVPVSGIGWVVADPTPDALTGVAAPPPEQARAVPTTLPVSRANVVPKLATGGGHAIAKPSRVPLDHPGGLPAWALALIASFGLVLVVLAWPVASAIRRRLRTRARQSTDPAVLATGAWLELLDGLDRAGMHIGGSLTGAEIAGESSGHFGVAIGPQVMRIAEVADQALYSIGDPPGIEDSEQAWQQQRELTRAVFRSLDRRQRARASVAVGSSPRRPSG